MHRKTLEYPRNYFMQLKCYFRYVFISWDHHWNLALFWRCL